MKAAVAAVAAVAAALVIALGGGVARAETPAEAQFKKGKALLAQKKYAEACVAFEKSDALVPEIGAKLNAAKCYEDWGKVATALKWYRDAEKMAAGAKDARLPKIHEHTQAVDDDTPRLTLKVPKDADLDAANVTLDGAKPKIGEPIEIDPGQHVVEFTNDAGERKKKTIPVERGGTSEVKLDLPHKGDVKNLPPPVVGGGEDPHPVEGKIKLRHVSDPGRGERIAGYVVGGVGVAAMLAAGYLTIDAHGDYAKALQDHCGGMTNGCDASGLKTTHDARKEANIATIVGGVGLAAIAGGIVLYAITPKPVVTYSYVATAGGGPASSLYVVPTIDATGGGVMLGGSF